MTDGVLYWRGKPVTDYSKEELVEIVTFLADQARCFNTAAAMEARAKERVAMFKSGAR